MMFLRWAVLVVLSFLAVPVAWICAPFLPAFASSSGWLPRSLCWFQTPDNSLDGDIQYRTLHAPFKWPENRIEVYVNRVFWLFRNPAYGFDFFALGFFLPPGCTVIYHGNPAVRNRPNGKHGFCYTVVSTSEKSWWHLRLVLPLWPGECFDINLGWRLQTYAENPIRLHIQSYVQYVFSVRPTPFA